ncbi:MAG: Hsp70 family protein, partial [Bacteroidota bacterium]|nr:Hsp70 family protein [Bacteroidota bacterium]
HAAEDKKKKEAIDVKNSAETFVFQIKKQLDEMKDKVPTDIKNRLESEIKKVEDAIASNNTEQIKTAQENLNKVWNEVASTLYQQANAQGAPNPQGPGPEDGGTGEKKKDDKDVQDASYEVVDDNK